jgi:hypothetical protein
MRLLVFEEADNAYMTFVTTDGSEAVKFDKALDINAATQIDATVTVGVDDTGYDVKFFGATTGKSLLWDESADSLIVTGTTTLVGTTNLDVVDIDGATQIDATVTVGVDDTGYDVKFFGATAGAYMLWDESADDLILGGAAGLSVNSTALVTGVLTTTAATVFNGGFASNANSTVGGTLSSGGIITTGNTSAAAASAGEGRLFPNNSYGAFVYGNGATYDVALGQRSTGVALGVLAGTTNVVIPTGNVGIGTSPAQKLHVLSASTTATVAKFAATNYGNAGTTYIEIGTENGDGGSRIGNINPSGNFGTLVFETMTAASGVFAERLRIDSLGGLITNPAAGGHAVFNEGGIDADFRVESDGNAHMLFVDAGNDQVVVGDSGNYYSKFTVVGSKTDSGNGPLNQLSVYDNSAMAANTGGSITLWGNYTTGDTQTEGASIEAVKANGTNANYQYGIWLKSRTHGGAMDSRLYMDQAQTIFNESGFDTDFRVESDGNTHMLFVDAGQNAVAIGNATASYAFHINENRAANYVFGVTNDGNNADRYGMIMRLGTDDGSSTNTYIAFDDGDGSGVGAITGSGGTITYATFTAVHPAILPDADNENGYAYGTLLDTTEITYSKRKNGQETERGIRYKVVKSASANSRAVLGAYAGKDPKYDNEHLVNVLGDGHILCNNSGGNIAVGDGVCTSATVGIGQKATASPSMIIGIAQEAVTFANNTETKLVAVQYGLQQFTPWS